MTETWARDLLEQAADTIDVGTQPQLPVPRPPRLWWPAVAAAAAVVVAITAALVLNLSGGSTPRPTRQSPGIPSGSATTGSPGTLNDPQGVARRFLAFVDGTSDHISTTPRVRLYLGNRFVRSIDAAAAEHRSSWRVCLPHGTSCPLSAIETLAGHQGQLKSMDHASTTDFCPATLAEGPPTDIGGDHVVALGPTGGSCAASFEVQLWYDDEQRLAAVNLLIGTAPPGS